MTSFLPTHPPPPPPRTSLKRTLYFGDNFGVKPFSQKSPSYIVWRRKRCLESLGYVFRSFPVEVLVESQAISTILRVGSEGIVVKHDPSVSLGSPGGLEACLYKSTFVQLQELVRAGSLHICFCCKSRHIRY